MALYQPRHVSAQMAYDALKANPSGLDWYSWARAAGLASSQLSYAQGLLREVLQTANGEPLIWKDSAGVYKLAQTKPELDIYLVWRFKSLTTMLYRIEQTMIAGRAKFGKTRMGKITLRDMKRVREDVADLVAHL